MPAFKSLLLVVYVAVQVVDPAGGIGLVEGQLTGGRGGTMRLSLTVKGGFNVTFPLLISL